MLSRIEINKLLALLKREVVPAIGCTEPMAVAMAVAKSVELLGEKAEHIEARLSGNIIKNAMGVGIPGSGGMVGLQAAIALGAVAGHSDYELEVLKDVTDEDVVLAKKMICDKCINVVHATDFDMPLYIEIKASSKEQSSKVVVANQHTHYVYLSAGDHVILDHTSELSQQDDDDVTEGLNLRKVYDFALEAPISDLRFVLEGASMNKSAAELAFNGDYGLNLGKMLKGTYESRMLGQTAMPRIVTYTCAACDIRMAGAKVPVMSNSGSGNQGIAATLPVAIFAEEIQASEAKMIRALTLSHLTVVYIKQLLGRLSAHCGCVVAATGSACGITYLMGGNYDQVTYAVKNMIASLTGMVCDGAKPSCSLKLSSGVSQAFQAAMMAVENICVSPNDGIIEKDVDKTIVNLANIGKVGMGMVDRMILNIMTSKDCCN